MGGSRSLLVIFVFTSLMIIDDLDAFRRAVAPDEANSPLVVDPDTMLALSCHHPETQVGFLELPPCPPASRRRPASEASAVPPLQCCRTCGSAGGQKAWIGRA